MNFPAAPDPHAIAVMVLTVIALALFMREKIPLETSSMIVIVALALGFELVPYWMPDGRMLHAIDFFHGFGHEALVAVCALMIVGQGLVRTGALEPLGGILARMWHTSPMLSLLVTLTIAAVLSAFVNNTPIVVLLLPVLISVSIRTRMSPSNGKMSHPAMSGIGSLPCSASTARMRSISRAVRGCRSVMLRP